MISTLASRRIEIDRIGSVAVAAAAAFMLAAGAVSAHAAPSAPAVSVRAVHSDTGETRACLPYDGGALVGTGGGLVKLGPGGELAAVWTASDGLPGTRIDAIAMLGDELWIGGDAGAAQIAFADDALAVTRTAGDRAVRDIARLGDVTYLATWGGGVHAVGGGRRTAALPYRVASRNAQRANMAALAVAGDTLYAGSAAGLFRLSAGKLELVGGLPDNLAITSLYGDGDRLWIASHDGLFVREAGTVRALGGGELRRVTAIDGAIVVAGVGDGLARVDRGRLVALPGAPRGLALAQAVAARDGAVCAGGLDGAWLRARPDAPWLRGAGRDGPPSNDVSALAADGDRLWAGTFDRGLALREAGAWRTIAHPDLDRRINALHVERRPGGGSRLWVGTASGLHAFDGRDVTRLSRADGLPSRSVLSLAGTRDGRLVVGTSQGAALLGTGRARRLGPKGADIGNVWAIAEDGDGELWLGTTTGLYRGSPDDDASWQRYSVATGHLRDDWVTALVADGRRVFAGTYHGGVTRIDLAAGAVAATQLGDGWINPGGLTLDAGRLLAATMDGLFVGDGATAAWAHIARLPGKDVTAAVRLGEWLIVSTRRGIAELR